MSKRGQVAGAAEAAVLVYDGRQSGVEHGDVGPQSLLPDPGAARGEGGDPQQHESAHYLALDLWSGPGRMRADQAALQLAAEFDRDVPSCQGAEASRYPVMRLLIISQGFNDLAGFANLSPSVVGNDELRVMPRHCYDVFT